MTKIAGVDPGLASGGLVVIEMEPERVIDAYSLVEKSGAAKRAKDQAKQNAAYLDGWSDLEFSAACLRAQSWRDQFVASLKQFENEHGAIDFFAIESFVDQRSRAKEEKARLIKNRWHTPLVMGHIAEVLSQEGRTMRNNHIFYQNAGIVIRQWNVEIARLKSRKGKEDLLMPGDSKITNDHLRKALAHAMALSLRLKQKGDQL